MNGVSCMFCFRYLDDSNYINVKPTENPSTINANQLHTSNNKSQKN